ncbi:MAG: alpha/beta fold hydrolase [Alphaproteobacteria bacterium]|nr:alpha/beta fold hydrolase [Alphaproteobacteria bacterium]
MTLASAAPKQNPPSPNPPHLRPKPNRHRAALNMATTLSALLSLPTAWPSLKNASPALKSEPLARLAELSVRHPDLAPHLTREMALRARRFMNGVDLYKKHPAQRGIEVAPVVWKSGTTLLRDYAPHAATHAPVVLVVPSLINRFTILDIQPEHSFLRLLAAHGFKPLVVDWNAPGEDERDFTLGDYVTERLVSALRVAAAKGPAHIIGYCMGGLLALALAQLEPSLTRSLSLLATPWDFHAGYDAAGQAGRGLEDKLQPWLSQGDFMPVDVIQGVFTSLQPMQAMCKFSNFAALDQTSLDAARFVLIEDWLNDGVALPAPAARECFGDFCARNVTAKGAWKVGDTIIDPHSIAVPSYVVVPGRDRIVPPESAMPLAHAIPHALRHEPMLGHIGIMASPQAPHQVWKPLVGWMEAH